MFDGLIVAVKKEILRESILYIKKIGGFGKILS